jgi:SSS family solute:Na+ symporter
MWQSVTVLVIFSGIFTFAGGLKAIAKVNVFQMILLIVVSLTLSFLGLQKLGGIDVLIAKTPSNFWNLVRPSDDAHYPWPAILLGYPVAAVAFFCTDQSMVQSVLGAKNLEQGQLGVNFIGWLKVMALPLFILPGILCYALYPELGSNSDLAYMTMVTNLFPSGMNGLVICVMIAVLVGTIGSSLNALSTVFTNDIYVKKINPSATIQDQIKIGRLTIAAGCVFAILIAVAIDNIKGQNLFNIFQAVLGFLAPSLSVVFLLSVFWKRTTKKAVNATLSWGSAFSLFVGVLYLWIFPADKYPVWPHFLLISFYIFAVLLITAVIISLTDKNPEVNVSDETDIPITSKKVKLLFGLLGLTILALYLVFNGN